MSNTDSWAKRAESHRYSQDDRGKQWRFEKELATKIDPFIDDAKQTSMVVGTYNLELEPWRMAAIISFRKYNLKILEKAVLNTETTEITLVKQKFSRTQLH